MCNPAPFLSVKIIIPVTFQHEPLLIVEIIVFFQSGTALAL